MLLPDDVSLRVAPIPALALLKITAWQDRKLTYPGRDAPDLLLYLRSYMDCGNMDRAASAHGDLFDADDYDHEVAGAQLLGRDVARLLDAPPYNACWRFSCRSRMIKDDCNWHNNPASISNMRAG